jgi:hypothetical protein
MMTITTARDLAIHATDLLNHTVLTSHASTYWSRGMTDADVEAAVEDIRADVEEETKTAHKLVEELKAYTGNNSWQDVLMPHLAPDRDQVDDSSGTVAVLECGTIVEYLESERRWRVAVTRA